MELGKEHVESSSDDMSRLMSMSKEDIQKELDTATGADSEPTETNETEPSGVDTNTEPTTDTTPPTDSSQGTEKTDSATTEPVKTNAELEELKLKYEKQLKQNQDHQAWIQRQANQLGMMKKLIEGNRGDQVSKEEWNAWGQQQQSAPTQQTPTSELDRVLSEINNDRLELQRKQWIESKVPDFSTKVERIIKMAVDEELIQDPNMAASLVQNPYSIPETHLYNLSRRLDALDKATQLEAALKAKDDEIAKLKSGLTTVPQKIKAAASNSVLGTQVHETQTSDSSPLENMTPLQLASMSKKDLDALTKKVFKK